MTPHADAYYAHLQCFACLYFMCVFFSFIGALIHYVCAIIKIFIPGRGAPDRTSLNNEQNVNSERTAARLFTCQCDIATYLSHTPGDTAFSTHTRRLHRAAATQMRGKSRDSYFVVLLNAGERLQTAASRQRHRRASTEPIHSQCPCPRYHERRRLWRREEAEGQPA